MSSAAATTRKSGSAPRAARSEPLSALVRNSIEHYYEELNGQEPADLYELVLSQVERPLLEVTMRQTRGNISKAAEFLGVNRATLRKKLQKYGLAD